MNVVTGLMAVASSPVITHVDGGKIEQVLNNLISNVSRIACAGIYVL